jgi:hypothetical protein
MPLKLQSSAGGSVTLDVPTTTSTSTLTFPANTGNVVIVDSLGTVYGGLATIQTGQVIGSSNTTTPSGYLPCDGSVYLQSSYSALAAVCNVAMFNGIYLANVRGIGLNFSAGLGQPTFAATSDGLLFYDAGVGLANAYVSFDSGTTWSTLRANVRPVSAQYMQKPTIAYNGTNYVSANTSARTTHDHSLGARYGSNVLTTMTGQTTTNVNKIISSIVWTGTYFIAVGNHLSGGAGDANSASISTDGVTWSLGGAISNLSSALHSSSNQYDKVIAFGNNTLVVATSNATSSTNNFTSVIMRYSTDNATSWTTITQPANFGVNNPYFGGGNTATLIAVTYANNQFVAIDSWGSVANSPNGIVWRTVSAGSSALGLPAPALGYSMGAYRSEAAGANAVTGLHSLGHGVSYTPRANGYYIFNNHYSTDLVTWKRFPQLAQTEPGSAMPTGAGIIQSTTGNYFFSGTLLKGDQGGCNQSYYTDPGYWNPTPNPGTQFSVPYITDEQTGMVRYYIKT